MSGNHNILQRQQPSYPVQTGTYSDGRPIMTFVANKDVAAPVVNVMDAGAVADGLSDPNASITSAGVTLTTTTTPGPFNAGMTGRYALVRGAGASGADLWATVTYVDAQTLTLSTAASTTVSGVTVYILNTDDFPALAAAMAQAEAGGGDLLLPAGVYYMDWTNNNTGAEVTQGAVRVRGAGRDATIIVGNGASAVNGSVLFKAAPGASLTLEELTVVAPATPNGQPSRGVWHAGTSGRLAVRYANLWGFASCIEIDTGATVVGTVFDCDLSTHPLDNLGGSAANVATCARFEVYNSNVHDYGVSGVNQNHGLYIWQDVDAVVVNTHFGTNRGLGWALKLYNGTGTSPNASIVNCYFAADSYQGILTNATVDTRIADCYFLSSSVAITIQYDADISGCYFETPVYAIQQSTLISTGTNVRGRGCTFNRAGTYDCVSNNISGNLWTFTACRFISPRANAVLNAAGAVTVLRACDFSDDGIGHNVFVSNTAVPTLSAINADVSGAVVTGNDARGNIAFSVVTATIPAGTALFTVTYEKSFPLLPVIVMLTNAAAAVLAGGYSANSANYKFTFTVYADMALPVGAGYVVAYMVMG